MRADADFYLERLYPMQDRALARLAPIEAGFYLTGGTAASRGYLHHRFSDDLDFFVNDDDRFQLWAQRVVQALARSNHDWHVEVVHQEARFVRLTVIEADLVLKIEMVNDVPAHVGELTRHPVLGLLEGARSKAAGLFPADLARVLLTVTKDDWQLVRWHDAPASERFIGDLKTLGERLLLLP